MKCGASALMGVIIKIMEKVNVANMHNLSKNIYVAPGAFKAISALLAFLVIFRVSQSYSRYWAGGTLLQKMSGSFLDSASSLLAFTTKHKASDEKVKEFRNMIVRLFSLLHAVSVLHLETSQILTVEEVKEHMSDLDVIDPKGLGDPMLSYVSSEHCKVEMVFHWIQKYMCQNLSSGVMDAPPPVVSRAFHELANGMVHFEDCRKVCLIPFPFPYAQSSLWLMVVYWFITPLTVCSWTERPTVVFTLTFCLLITVFCLYGTADMLEQPFGVYAGQNRLDARGAQIHMNKRLLMLLSEAGNQLPALPEGHVMPVIEEKACLWNLGSVLRASEVGKTMAEEVCDEFDSDAETSTEADVEVGTCFSRELLLEGKHRACPPSTLHSGRSTQAALELHDEGISWQPLHSPQVDPPARRTRLSGSQWARVLSFGGLDSGTSSSSYTRLSARSPLNVTRPCAAQGDEPGNAPGPDSYRAEALVACGHHWAEERSRAHSAARAPLSVHGEVEEHMPSQQTDVPLPVTVFE